MLKPINQATNKKTIMVYYSLAVILISVGLFTNKSTWYIMAVAFLGIALFRKYWLHKRLKE